MADKKILTCPLDPSHKVKESRMQIHIVKDHPGPPKRSCQFNAAHLVDEVEYEYHLLNCPDRAPLDRLLTQNVDKNNPYKARNAVPQFSNPHVEIEENWDTDFTEVKMPEPPSGAIIEPPAFAKPAERKELYYSLHQLPSEPEKAKSPPVTEILRQPRQPFKSEPSGVKAQQSNSKVNENVDLRRGSSSKIAANIFKNAENGPSTSATYSNVVKDMSNLNLSTRISNSHAKVPVFEKDDFPALGCGRGASQAPISVFEKDDFPPLSSGRGASQAPKPFNTRWK